jgi:WD40 repeat protein
LWNAATGKRIETLTGRENSVNAVAVTPDGRRAVTASTDETVRLWDLDAGQAIQP